MAVSKSTSGQRAKRSSLERMNANEEISTTNLILANNLRA